jgi:hypothetical protein
MHITSLSDRIINAIKSLTTFQQQPDATISQANPVSTTLYPVLATNVNVRIISIQARLDWATTQPTDLRVTITVDGVSHTYSIALAVTATSYYVGNNANLAAESQTLQTTDQSTNRAFLLEGRSVKVEISCVWGTTQPTPLICRVRWAKK